MLEIEIKHNRDQSLIDELLKSPDRPNTTVVVLIAVALVAIAEALKPGVVATELARTPIVVARKTPNCCAVDIKFVQLIFARQVPVAITV